MSSSKTRKLPLIIVLAVVVANVCVVSPLMDVSQKEAFLASIEDEASFLSSQPAAAPTPRRLSAANKAALLKAKNLIPPLNPPTDRRTSLPRASKIVSAVPAPTSKKMPDDAARDKTLLEQIDLMIRASSDKVRNDIASLESSTSKKIDDLSNKLTSRLNKAEKDLSQLGIQIAETRQEVEELKTKNERREAHLHALVDEVVAKRLTSVPPPAGAIGRRPRQIPPQFGPNDGNSTPVDVKEERYWEARRSLRLWPITGENLCTAVLQFLTEKLLCPTGKVTEADFTVERVISRPGQAAQDQAVVKFGSVRLRDEIKSLGRNLSGQDRSIGMQLEPPDHLRSHYQAFQKLAFQMKKKSPGLRRNIKFYDGEMCLSMDILRGTGGEWRTIMYNDARAILKKSRERVESLSRNELEDLVDLQPDNSRKRRRTLADSDSSDMEDDDENDVTIVENDVNNKKDNNYPSLSFINTNARSLKPKVEALHDCFTERRVNLAVVTETWFQGNRDSDDVASTLEGKYALGMIVRNRGSVAANGRQYGGVAIINRKSVSTMKEFPIINPDNYEIVAGVGKIHGVKGKVFILGCYLPPNITTARAKANLEFISDVLGEAKRKFEGCSIIVAGDFNQWPAQELRDEHPELTEVLHGPTRGDREIDRTLTNFGRSVIKCGTIHPLDTEEGSESDHKIACFEAVFDRAGNDRVTYSYLHYTQAGATTFLDELSTQTWEEVERAETTSSKVEVFQGILDKLLGRNFKWKTTTRRKKDKPWINDRIRWLAGKSRKLYDREGRSRRWRNLKKKIAKLTKARAGVHRDNVRQAMTGPEACRDFFRNVQNYSSREKPPQFDIRELFPNKSDVEVADKVAEHFNKISSEFQGLRPEDVPSAQDLDLPLLSVETVAQRLRKMKKPRTKVKGDIFPCLVNRASAMIAGPLANIYNSITSSGTWPSLWKIEYVTPIPKKTHPESLDDIRNISCTQFLSKTYESFILEWLGQQVKIRKNQYGGVKGSGSEHFLVETWQRVLEGCEDPRAGVLLSSIDYSKAFNRLDFAECLRALKRKGACQQLIRIVASFLTDRQMTVRIGSAFSDFRVVLGGVPQGSLLGVLLFNLAIDSYEANSNDVACYDPPGGEEAFPAAPGATVPARVPDEPTERDYRHLPVWQTEPLYVLKYVDDNVIIEKLNFDPVPTGGDGTRVKHAVRTQNLFRLIVHEAEMRGMRVNGKKTKALLISELKSYLPKAFFNDENGDQIKAGETMTILGFTFSSDVGMGAQVEAIRKKFYARKWILHHLGHAGFSEADLLKVYKSVILPIHDYCSCVYNSSLTQTQASALERLQAQALKAIYGYEHSYRALLEKSGLLSLQARRNARDEKFAMKCLQSERFRTWFPLQPVGRPTRSPLTYTETYARTKRLYDSPIYNMRRILNRKQIGRAVQSPG